MAKIQLTNGGVARVDDDDVPLVSDHSWWRVQLSRNCQYAATKMDGKRVLMHRWLLGLSPGNGIADHLDGDGLNNRRNNLRAVSRLENARNRVAKYNSQTGITGVTFRADHGCSGAYIATMWLNGRLQTRTFGCLSIGRAEALRRAIEVRRHFEDEHGYIHRSAEVVS